MRARSRGSAIAHLDHRLSRVEELELLVGDAPVDSGIVPTVELLETRQCACHRLPRARRMGERGGRGGRGSLLSHPVWHEGEVGVEDRVYIGGAHRRGGAAEAVAQPACWRRAQQHQRGHRATWRGERAHRRTHAESERETGATMKGQ
eukprot:scaffold195847_cov33-Tisochrysis_lutea.AAC.4